MGYARTCSNSFPTVPRCGNFSQCKTTSKRSNLSRERCVRPQVRRLQGEPIGTLRAMNPWFYFKLLRTRASSYQCRPNMMEDPQFHRPLFHHLLSNLEGGKLRQQLASEKTTVLPSLRCCA